MNMVAKVFDFDDVLVKTDSFVIVNNKGKTKKLTPGQYAIYNPKSGDQFDYGHFRGELKNPRSIIKYNKLLIMMHRRGNPIFILTARSDRNPIAKYLSDMGIKRNVTIIVLNSSDPQRKKEYIKKLINRGYNDIEFFDDSPKYISAVNTLKDEFPAVRITTRLVPRQ